MTVGVGHAGPRQELRQWPRRGPRPARETRVENVAQRRRARDGPSALRSALAGSAATEQAERDHQGRPARSRPSAGPRCFGLWSSPPPIRPGFRSKRCFSAPSRRGSPSRVATRGGAVRAGPHPLSGSRASDPVGNPAGGSGSKKANGIGGTYHHVRLSGIRKVGESCGVHCSSPHLPIDVGCCLEPRKGAAPEHSRVSPSPTKSRRACSQPATVARAATPGPRS
jgi:hypothetical protein